MKKSLLAASFAAVAALAAIGGGSLASAASVAQTPAYSFVDTDGGSCGSTWALILGGRQFSLPAPDPAGNYAIVEKFVGGTFSTVAGVSPGACDAAVIPGPNNGHLVTEGVHGSWFGNEHVFVNTGHPGGTYTAGDGSCNGHPSSDLSNPCTTDSYVFYHYGTHNWTAPSYAFTYKTISKQAKAPKMWKELSTNGTTEADTGDIYTGP